MRRESEVGEFNPVQEESGKGGCSNGSAHNWLKQFRPKVAICLHELDYCDTCAKLSEDLRSKQTTLNRLKQTGSVSEEEVHSLDTSIKELSLSLEEHKQTAQKSHKYHLEIVERFANQWKRIKELEGKSAPSEEEELTRLRNLFSLTISADYQMSKLIPFWGMSPQPGSTYYLQKLSNDIFGIVDHSSGESTVYTCIFDERLGQKNSDHTISYISDYLASIPSWVKRIHLFLDNAGSMNKNMYLMA